MKLVFKKKRNFFLHIIGYNLYYYLTSFINVFVIQLDS